MFQADYVLVCISPGYRKLVESEGGSDELDEESYENSLHAKYIHTRIHSEYIVEGSRNRFIVPLLVSGATRVRTFFTFDEVLFFQLHKKLRIFAMDSASCADTVCLPSCCTGGTA